MAAKRKSPAREEGEVGGPADRTGKIKNKAVGAV
jgi:hypothetical protein